MGRLKEFLIQMQEDEAGVKLSETLGISYMDLTMLDYNIQINKSANGSIYGYTIVFNENSPRSILEKIKRLDKFKVELDADELDTYEEEYYEDKYEAIISNNKYYLTFLREIENLKRIVGLKVEDNELKEILLRQIFIGVFGTLETFLSDTFINLTLENEQYLKNFVKSHPEFRKQKFELREIFESHDSIEETSKKVMLDTIYHDLPKVRKMYTSTFKIDFPDLADIIKQVSIRHHLVHRNGKTKEGVKININEEAVLNLIKIVFDFAKAVGDKLNLTNKIIELPF